MVLRHSLGISAIGIAAGVPLALLTAHFMFTEQNCRGGGLQTAGRSHDRSVYLVATTARDVMAMVRDHLHNQ